MYYIAGVVPTIEAMILAVKYNCINIVTWLRSVNCPWDSDVTFHSTNNNNFNLFMWLVSNGCPYDIRSIREAINLVNVGIVEFLIIEGVSTKLLSKLALENHHGHYVIKYLVDNDYPVCDECSSILSSQSND